MLRKLQTILIGIILYIELILSEDLSYSLVKMMKIKNSLLWIFKKDNQYFSLEIINIKNNCLQFLIKDLDNNSFEMPNEEPFPYHKLKKNNIFQDTLYIHESIHDFDYDIDISSSSSIDIIRKSTKEIIFSSSFDSLVLKKNYIQISTSLPSHHLYGIGERTINFTVPSGIYTLYNKDIVGKIEDGKGKGIQRYGSHPMYLMREKSGKYYISYLRNSLPMDIVVDHDESRLTYKIVGGIFDFTLFLGDENPESVIKEYHSYLGGYSLPPFWSFGFHQSRWGYENITVIEEVLDKYDKLNLPLDVIWNDIDYMNNKQSLTIDYIRYSPQKLKEIKNKYNKKYVIIFEPTVGISNKDFEFYKKGINKDIFIKNSQGNNLINVVWTGLCHFIDFFNPNSQSFWEEALNTIHKDLNYDGIWLDMNEVSGFSNGQIYENWNSHPCQDTNIFPYIPGTTPLEDKTICPNSIHYNGLLHYQVHNFYPNIQAKRTYEVLENLFPDQFPFILSRANAPGLGKYAAHWSGDNLGTYDFYKFSLSEVFNSNLFGIPMIGADICGFDLNTTETLCSQWYQMGSLYPFSRAHAHIESYRKEPFAMGDLLYETTLKSLQFRYSILKYYYSLFMLNEGRGTIFRPLFFEFYDDPILLEDKYIQNSFLIGSSLLVIPNFNEINKTNTTNIENKIEAYFPKGDWYDLRTSTRVNKSTNSETIEIENSLRDMPPVYLRSGRIIFMNSVDNVKSTEDLNNIFSLVIGFNTFDKSTLTKVSEAEVFLPTVKNYNSKLEIENCIKNNCYIKIKSRIDYNNNLLNISFSKANFYDSNYDYIEIVQIKVFGITLPNNIEFNNTNYKITKINEYCLLISFTNSIKVMKENLNLNFELSNK